MFARTFAPSGTRPGDAVDALRALLRDALGTHRHYFALRLDTVLAAALLDAGKPVDAAELLQNGPSKRSRSITLVHAAMKSFTNFSFESAHA